MRNRKFIQWRMWRRRRSLLGGGSDVVGGLGDRDDVTFVQRVHGNRSDRIWPHHRGWARGPPIARGARSIALYMAASVVRLTRLYVRSLTYGNLLGLVHGELRVWLSRLNQSPMAVERRSWLVGGPLVGGPREMCCTVASDFVWSYTSAGGNQEEKRGMKTRFTAFGSLDVCVESAYTTVKLWSVQRYLIIG